ncbi:MAG: Stp1/IreP family PP2C-type Ser/Thr phosphatase [Anaerolineae bacterium]|nr:Stp1/IreP family PP2C-type Ser/Thr phosphatase [Anaerolineae bacterium]
MAQRGRFRWFRGQRKDDRALPTTQELPSQGHGLPVTSASDRDDATERLDGGFPALPAGTVLGSRYVVREVRAVGEHRNVYLAEDLVASRRCPGCSAVTSDEAERYCSDCGADLAKADSTLARYLVSEDDSDRAVRCERQLLGMQLAHPGLLLPAAVFEEVHYGAPRTYRVMPEFLPPLLQSLKGQSDAVSTGGLQAEASAVAAVARLGADLAQAMAFLHKHQVALGTVDAAHIAVNGQHALWVGLGDATIVPPEQRTRAHEVFARDVQALGRVLAGLLPGGDTPHPDAAAFDAAASGALVQLLRKTVEHPMEVRAAALASGLQSILTEMRSEPMRIGHCTDVGLVRELNEDSYLVLDLGPVPSAGTSVGAPSALYVVADGMGGYDAGEIASGLVVQTMGKLAREVPREAFAQNGSGLSSYLKRWAAEANSAVHAARRSANSEMGTTLVAALTVGTTAIIANVGDSRCYHIGTGGIRRVTTDHSLVERLVAAGQIGRDEADAHPQRNVIYRAIGDQPEVEIDLFEVSLLGDEALLLCSDGLSGKVPDERLLDIWRTSVSPQEACDRMVTAANQAGGEDNITVIIVQGRIGGQPLRQ